MKSFVIFVITLNFIIEIELQTNNAHRVRVLNMMYVIVPLYIFKEISNKQFKKIALVQKYLQENLILE